MHIKLKIFLGLVILNFDGLGQIPATRQNQLTTFKFAGTYSFGDNVEKARVGTIMIYPETDSTVLFYIDLNKGAPSYNMGEDWGRLKIINGTGTYFTKEDDDETGCKWNLKFTRDTLKINTIDAQYNCGFGGGVFADGTYMRISKKTPLYFDDQGSTRRYFKDLKF